MACANNGKLSRIQLKRIPQGFLAKDDNTADSWLAMYRDARGDGVTLVPGGPDSSYRTFSRQVFWRNVWCARGTCFKAAVPGTSNHGCGKAVDVRNATFQTSREFQWLRQHAFRYNWDNQEGAGVGENWHWGYRGGWKAPPDPLDKLPKHMKLAASKLLFHRREAIAEKITGEGPRYKMHVKWRKWWFKRVAGQHRRSKNAERKALLKRVLDDKNGVL